MKKRDKLKVRGEDGEWSRVYSKISSDTVRITVPRAFLSILTLLFHHISDAMAGDDRPDHGLAKIRQGREQYRVPFYFLYGKIKRVEKKMSDQALRKAAQVFYQYLELSAKRKHRFHGRNGQSFP